MVIKPLPSLSRTEVMWKRSSNFCVWSMRASFCTKSLMRTDYVSLEVMSLLKISKMVLPVRSIMFLNTPFRKFIDSLTRLGIS